MLKVLQHVKSYHTTHGGVERVVEELVPELNGYPDLEVDVLCQGPDTRDYPLSGRGAVYQAKTDFGVSTAGLSWRDLRVWQRIAPQYDVVHVHLPWPQSNLNLLLKRFAGAVVVHWHSDIVRQRLLYSGFRWLERWLLRRADKICVTSPKLLEQSASLEGYRHKAVSVPIGIPEATHEIRDDEARSLRAQYGDRPIVFALGRLVPYKGYEYLIRAAATLQQEGLILIGGEGPLRGTLETLIRDLGVGKRVKLLGKVANRDVELLFRACSLFCLPSIQKSEAFGIVQIEAMRASRPVVSTRIHGSGVDWVNRDGETGFTVELGNAVALADALNRMLSDHELLRRFGMNARRRYEELFTARRMGEEVRKAYLSLRI